MKARSMNIVASLFLMTAGPASARAIWAQCNHGVIDSNMTPGLAYDAQDNSPLMRYGAAQYVSGAGSQTDPAHYVVGWVSTPDSQGIRSLRWAQIRVPSATCRSVVGPAGQPAYSVPSIADVNWVHRGGHVPAGQLGKTGYPAHGYLVWSDSGDEVGTIGPRVYLGRFTPGVSGLITPQQVSLMLMSGENLGRGITPSMATNRPMPFDMDLPVFRPGSVVPFLACYLATHLPPPFDELFEKRCDYGHRLLLVFAGDMRFVDSGGKQHFEHIGDDATSRPFWLPYSIKYVLLKPNGEIVDHGTIADVRDNEDNLVVGGDPLWDHAIYPEVVWNAHTRRFNIMWEESYKALVDDDPSGAPTEKIINVRKMATVDEEGTVDVTPFFRRCRNLADVTVVDPGKPPASPMEGWYCYPITMGNDYYSSAGIWLGSDPTSPEDPFNRNHLHYTAVRAYSWHHVDYPSGFHFVDEDAEWLVVNRYTQEQPEDTRKATFDTIGFPYIRQVGFDWASCVKAEVRYSNYRCWNQVLLIVDEPEHWIDPPAHHQMYTVDIDEAPRACHSAAQLATSSSMWTFISLYAEENLSGQKTVRFSSYYYYP